MRSVHSIEAPLITDETITRKYGEMLRAGRKRAGRSQAEAAEHLKVDQAVVSRWESGKLQPAIGNLMELARFYDCRVSGLMPRNQYPSAPLDPRLRRRFFWARNWLIQQPGSESLTEAELDELEEGYQARRAGPVDRPLV